VRATLICGGRGSDEPVTAVIAVPIAAKVTVGPLVTVMSMLTPTIPRVFSSAAWGEGGFAGHERHGLPACVGDEQELGHAQIAGEWSRGQGGRLRHRSSSKRVGLSDASIRLAWRRIAVAIAVTPTSELVFS
jgi:hypothetical protein